MARGRMTAQAVALAAVAVLLGLLIWHLTHQPKHAKAGVAGSFPLCTSDAIVAPPT